MGKGFGNFYLPSNERSEYTKKWRRQDFTFNAGNLYSVAKFNPIIQNNYDQPDNFNNNGFRTKDKINQLNEDPFWNVGIIITDESFDPDNNIHQFPHNGYIGGTNKAFGANWLNFCLYFPQSGILREFSAYSEFGGAGTNTHFTPFVQNPHFHVDNEDPIAADKKNTKWFARSDLHYTDFIRVEKSDIIKIIDEIGDQKGFTKEDIPSVILDGDYRNGESPCPQYGGKEGGDPYSNEKDTDFYFYRGYGESDCFEFIQSLGLV